MVWTHQARTAQGWRKEFGCALEVDAGLSRSRLFTILVRPDALQDKVS